MDEGYRVKGSTLNTKVEFVRQRFGEGAVQQLRARLSSESRGTTFESGWYPYEQYVEILNLIAELHYGGDVARLVEVGEYSADQALGTTYGAFVVSGDFPGFLKRISHLHSMFYSRGHTEVSMAEDGSGCEIRHRKKPDYAEADMYVALGFYQGSGHLHGLENISGWFAREPEGVTFTLTW